MTDAAKTNAQIDANKAMKEKEIEAKKEMQENEHKENARQREHETKENRKKNLANLGGGLLKMFKISSKINDPEFYKKFVKEISTLVNLPTYQRLGDEAFVNLLNKAVTGVKYNLPGIMVISYEPMIGPQSISPQVAENPVNQSLMRTKEQVLKSNSRSSTKWEPSDAGLNIICTCDIFAEYYSIRRALQIYQTYNGENAYLAEKLIKALGIDYDDLVANYADYKKQLVIVAKRINSSIICPSDITLVKRRIYLINNVFLDTGDFKNVKQMYLYRQDHFFRLNLAGDSAELTNVTWVNRTLADMFDELTTNIQRITENPDYIEMYQDLRHAFGDKIYKVEETFDSSSTVYFNIDESNREQIHNIVMMPLFKHSNKFRLDYSDLNIHQDTNGYLVQGYNTDPATRKIKFEDTSLTDDQLEVMGDAIRQIYGESGEIHAYLMDTYHRPITGDDILDLTRGMFTLGYPTVDKPNHLITWQILSCGTELFTGARVYWLLRSGTGKTLGLSYYSTHMLEFYDTTDKVDIHNQYSIWAASTFDWMPITHLYGLNKNKVTPMSYDADILWKGIYTDLENTFTIDFKDLKPINDACVLSEFYLESSDFKTV